jgi:hypothetical protein
MFRCEIIQLILQLQTVANTPGLWQAANQFSKKKFELYRSQGIKLADPSNTTLNPDPQF